MHTHTAPSASTSVFTDCKDAVHSMHHLVSGSSLYNVLCISSHTRDDGPTAAVFQWPCLGVSGCLPLLPPTPPPLALRLECAGRRPHPHLAEDEEGRVPGWTWSVLSSFLLCCCFPRSKVCVLTLVVASIGSHSRSGVEGEVAFR